MEVIRGAALIANLNELQRALLQGRYVDPVLARSLGYDPCEFDDEDKLPDPKRDDEKKERTTMPLTTDEARSSHSAIANLCQLA